MVEDVDDYCVKLHIVIVPIYFEFNYPLVCVSSTIYIIVCSSNIVSRNGTTIPVLQHPFSFVQFNL